MEKEKLKDILKINSVAVYTSTESFYDIIITHKDPSVFFNNPDDIIFPNELLKERVKKLVKDAASFDAEKELNECEKLGVKIITCLDDDYPEELKNIHNPPLVLYYRGRLEKRLSIAIVGTRTPTDYGIKHASKISYDLSRAGICIISGLARGIDSVVHKAVIKSRGITFAVIGSGLKRIYPPENSQLVEKIIECGGAVISEYPLHTKPFKFNFPRRNRLISALSVATLVIEGDYNSGALITARYAIEQGKEVMALPGPVDLRTSNGPNKLIRDGAHLVRDAIDVIESLPPRLLFGIDMSKIVEKEEKKIKLTPPAQEIYNLLKEKGGLNVDEISDYLSMDISEVFGYIFELESLGVIEAFGAKYKVMV